VKPSLTSADKLLLAVELPLPAVIYPLIYEILPLKAVELPLPSVSQSLATILLEDEELTTNLHETTLNKKNLLVLFRVFSWLILITAKNRFV
jgi:hypothetical protein